MSMIGAFLRSVKGAPTPRSDERDVELQALTEASRDADVILDNALTKVLRDTDRLMRKLRRSEPAGATGTN